MAHAISILANFGEPQPGDRAAFRFATTTARSSGVVRDQRAALAARASRDSTIG